MTRCIPVSGRFTDRQRAVYNAVLSVMQDAMKLLRPGVSLHDYHKEVGDLMTAQLLDLKLIDRHDVEKQNPAWPAYKKYFMHGTSHFIGLDVHDVGHWHEPIAPGHVFTVEPGIYIREETSASASKTTSSSRRTASTTSWRTSRSRPTPSRRR